LDWRLDGFSNSSRHSGKEKSCGILTGNWTDYQTHRQIIDQAITAIIKYAVDGSKCYSSYVNHGKLIDGLIGTEMQR